MKYEKSSIALLVSFVILLIFALTLRTIIGEVRQAVLDGHWQELVSSIDVIGEQADTFVETDQDWNEYDYSSDLCIVTELLDARPGVFCALYDEDGRLLSKRTITGHETRPYDNPGFIEAIGLYGRGEVTIDIYSKTSSSYIQMLCYFRWIPSGPQYTDKLLLVVAISDDVLNGNPTERLVLWCVAMLAVGGFSTVAAGVLIATRPRTKGARRVEL